MTDEIEPTMEEELKDIIQTQLAMANRLETELKFGGELSPRELYGILLAMSCDIIALAQRLQEHVNA